MKIKSNESILETHTEYSIFTGHFSSNSEKENLYYKKARPNQYEEGIVFHIVIIHDLFEYHMRHQKILKYMENRYKGRVEITWLDLKGHGMSSGTRSHISDFSELTLNLLKLLNLDKLVDGKIQNRKTILFGHGLGGMIMLDLMMNYRDQISINIDGLIFSNPDIFVSKKFPSWALKLLNYAGNLMSSIRLPSPLKGIDLTDNPKNQKLYNSDPLINHFCSLSLVNQIMIKSKEVRGCSYFLDYPSLFLLSDNDIWGDSHKTEIFAKGMSKRYKTLYIYKDSLRELTNSKISDKVFYDIFSWLNKLDL